MIKSSLNEFLYESERQILQDGVKPDEMDLRNLIDTILYFKCYS